MKNTAFKSLMLIGMFCVNGALQAANSDPEENLFQNLDDKTQELKLRILDLNREVNQYAAQSDKDIADRFKGKNRAEFSLDFVYRDQREGHYLDAINRYHAGRDFGVILSKYETALKVANIYLDYGLYHYSKKIFTSLLGDEDSAVASLAKYYLAKHDYLKQYWDDALHGFESVTDGIPLHMLDKKRIMQSIILQNRKRHDEAIRVLSEIQPASEYYVYARFNMAISFLRKGWWSDAEDIIYTLLKSDKLEDPLRDRFYIALGYSQLQREYYREAYESLKQVSKNGPYSYKAQLGLGIVAAEQENYREALKRLESIKQSYSKQLVAEEAHIVIPFILESIGSLDTTTQYYATAAKYYQGTIEEIGSLQSEIIKGQYDSLFGKSPGKDVEVYGSADNLIKRYMYELVETSRWKQASRNLLDLQELLKFIDELTNKLTASGKYDGKIYGKLKGTIENNQHWLADLSRQYQQYLRSMMDSHLDTRKKYFVSYLNQSQFALARLYDTTLGANLQAKIADQTITEEKVRSLYRQYLQNATASSHNRRTAMLRLTELELDKYDQLQAQNSMQMDNSRQAQQKLKETIELLKTVLADYPDHEDNDKVLYQLVTAYDKEGTPDKAQLAMRQLVDNYPQSRFYTEMQFKLGEKYLTTDDSIDAELAYTAAIQRENPNSSFYWRALYKRGWSRLRQSVYEDALDDFFQVLTLSGLADKRTLDAGDSELYSDILRGISLCFANMGGLDRLNDYFEKHSDSPYAYLAYQELGEMYESQNRVYDAVEVYEAYISHNEKSSYAPKFLIKIIQSWEKGNQTKKALQARNRLESNYSIQSAFWKDHDINQYKNIQNALETNAVYMASHYHGLFQRSNNPQHLQNAKYWYERFVKYESKAKDAADTYFMYAELLTESGEPDKALAYYEKADKGNVDLQAKKEAAYAAVVTANRIYEKNRNSTQHDKWLTRKVDYTLGFIKKYPGDQRSLDATLHTLENLYSQKKYKKAIEILDQIPQAITIRINDDLQLYRAHCLFALNDFKAAEIIYADLYGRQSRQKVHKQMLSDRLASSIYKQGELAEQSGDTSLAIEHFLRVYQKAPESDVAAVAEFDAATALIKQNKRERAISILERFLKTFKGHRLEANANNKLAVLYLDGVDKQKSAYAFERAARDKRNDSSVRRDSLWQAAQINEELKNTSKAISLYNLYIADYHSFHEPAMEAKARLASLYEQINDLSKKNDILSAMVESESKIRHNMSTERTRYLAANATLELVRQKIDAYQKIKIKTPLKVTLKQKKAALKDLVGQLTSVTDYSIEETTTQAIYHIAEAYRDFSKALMNSPRPANLKDLELQQYELLLEEQAFPFEEKALSFYKENLKVIKEGVYNKWVKSSFERLTKLVPARYDKHEKLDAYIDIPLESSAAIY